MTSSNPGADEASPIRSALPNAKNVAAAAAPNGVHLPKTIAATAMNPSPDGMWCSKWSSVEVDNDAPPSPASAPLKVTAPRRSCETRTPIAATALGFSPTARSRKPHGVRDTAPCTTKGSTIASQVNGE